MCIKAEVYATCSLLCYSDFMFDLTSLHEISSHNENDTIIGRRI